jgi:hypothetical protein
MVLVCFGKEDDLRMNSVDVSLKCKVALLFEGKVVVKEMSVKMKMSTVNALPNSKRRIISSDGFIVNEKNLYCDVGFTSKNVLE